MNTKIFKSTIEFGFMDTSTAFAESLITMYNYVFFFLVIVFFLVLLLLSRLIILYVYRYQSDHLNLVNYFFHHMREDDQAFQAWASFYRMLLQSQDSVNKGYAKVGNKAFLEIYDLSEYKLLELAWCAFPTLILACIIWPSFSLLYSLDPALDPVLTVRAIGHQWYWSYEVDFFMQVESDLIKANNYFDSVMLDESDLHIGEHRLYEVDNRLVVPMGVPVRFVVTSADVLHSWAIPSMGVKVDAVPGRLNQFVTIIKRPGVFYGQCSELCGPLHGFMPIVLQAVSYPEFIDFVNDNYEVDIVD